MPKRIVLRELTADERVELERLARARTQEAQPARRARIILGLTGGRPSQVAAEVGVGRMAVYDRMKRFNAGGTSGLADRPRSGRRRTPPSSGPRWSPPARSPDTKGLGNPRGFSNAPQWVAATRATLNATLPTRNSKLGEALEDEE